MLLVARSRRLNADRLSLESRYRAIIEQAQDGLLVADARTGEIVDANPAVQQQLGFTLDELRGRSVLSVLRGPNDSQDPVIATLARVEPSRGVELVQWLKDGRQIDVEVSCVPIESSDRRLVSYLMRDLSERKKAQTQLLANQQRLDKLANHDHLTGLPNRLFLQAHLPEAIARCQEAGQMLAVLFLDLDRFKHINDSRGHEVGDKLLQEIAKRVRAAVRPADIVVRMGGDEFVVVLHRVNAPDEVAIAATRINEVLSAPVMIDGRALVATVSIGVSMFPRDGATMGELLKHSDTAMYQAKDLGRNNFQVFSPQMDRSLKERVAIESSLRAGLKLHQFDVHYQPIIDIHTRRVAGLESLLRWKHPTQGYVSPERFIEVAEETGLIIPIGQFVLDRIGRDITAWRDQGAHLVPVSMNVSAVQLERTKLRELIQQAMEKIPHRAAADRAGAHRRLAVRDAHRRIPRGRAGILARPGREDRHRRFRHRLLVVVVPQALARGLAEDRPQLRARHRHRSFGSRHRQRHRRHGAQPEHPGGRRRHRDLAAARDPAQHGLQPGAGIPVRQALRRRRRAALPAGRAARPARERLAEQLAGRHRLADIRRNRPFTGKVCT